MTLYEVLKPLNLDTLVLIHNIDKKPRKKGRPQYQKLRNIPWEKIHNDLNKEVMSMCVHKDNGGLYIQLHDREKLERSLNNWDLVDKYFVRKDQYERRGEK